MSEHCSISIKSSTRNDEQPQRTAEVQRRRCPQWNQLSGEGRPEEAGSGYIYIWKEKHDSFAIKTSIYQVIPTAISEQLMTIHLPLPTKNYITLVLVYTLTPDAEDTKNQFYHNWQMWSSNTTQEKLLILGDLNMRVGKNHHREGGSRQPQHEGPHPVEPLRRAQSYWDKPHADCQIAMTTWQHWDPSIGICLSTPASGKKQKKRLVWWKRQWSQSPCQGEV